MDDSGKPERKSWVKNFFKAQLEGEWFDLGDIFDCLPESILGDLSGLVSVLLGLAAMAAVLCGLAIFLYGLVVIPYQLIVDPDAVHVAARLDSLSINPDKRPRS